MPATQLKTLPYSLVRFIFTLSLLTVVAIVAPSFALDPKANHNTPSLVPAIPTIESTNYSIPNNAIYVSQSRGKSTNTGAYSSPLQTLEQAISKAPTGSTVVVESGIYREGNLKTWKEFNIQAAPNSQVWFDGSEVTSGWVADTNGGYRLNNSPSNALCNLGTGCLDAADQINPDYPMSWSPQMVFVNDVALTEVKTRAQASSGNNFYYDISSNTLYIGINPSGNKVEVTTKRKFLDISSPKGSLKGIGIRRYGSVLSPANVQGSYHGAALILAEGGSGRPQNFLFENNTFFQNASRGLSINYTDGTIVRGNAFLSNGSNGFDAFQSNNLLVEKNLIRDNNKENFNITDSANAVIAGSKMVKVKNSTIKNNIVEFNNGAGLWCDLACVNVKYYENVIHSNGKHGIFYELSENGTIASNLIYKNKGEGIKIASPNAKIVNNTLIDNGNNIAVYEDPRRVTNADPYADTRNTTIVNNLFSTSSNSTTNRLLEINGFNNPDSVIPSQMVTELDYNAYYRENSTKPSTLIGYRGSTVSNTYSSFNAVQSAGLERNGIGLDGSSNVLFVDPGSFNFRVHPDSRAAIGSKPLSGNLAYIAQDLGYSTTASFGRGAITWQNIPNPPVTPPRPTQPPVTQPPATQPPVTQPPATQPPVTQPPVTAPPTQPPVAQPLDIAVNKLIADHNLAKVKVYSFDGKTLRARAYLKYGGFLHVAADITANIDASGNYQLTSVNWIVSFWPIS